MKKKKNYSAKLHEFFCVEYIMNRTSDKTNKHNYFMQPENIKVS